MPCMALALQVRSDEIELKMLHLNGDDGVYLRRLCHEVQCEQRDAVFSVLLQIKACSHSHMAFITCLLCTCVALHDTRA